MIDEHENVRVRVEVRRRLRLHVQEAKQQGCLEEARRFPGVFAAFALFDSVIGDAVERGVVTLDDLVVWLAVVLSQA